MSPHRLRAPPDGGKVVGKVLEAVHMKPSFEMGNVLMGRRATVGMIASLSLFGTALVGCGSSQAGAKADTYPTPIVTALKWVSTRRVRKRHGKGPITGAVLFALEHLWTRAASPTSTSAEADGGTRAPRFWAR